MKKTLIAVAALVATGAFAQSTVTISGNIDFAGMNISGTQSGAKGTTFSTTQGTSSTSVLRFIAAEDFGGGMKATAQYNIDPRSFANDGLATTNNLTAATTAAPATTVTGLGRDEVFVGLSGNFGNVRLGSANALGLEVAGDSSPLGTGVGSGYAPNASTMFNTTVTTRYNRSIRFDSPVMGGVQAVVLYAPGNDEASFQSTSTFAGGATNVVNVARLMPNARQATEMGLKYSNGPLNASFATIKVGAQTNQLGWYAASANGLVTSALSSVGTTSNIFAVNYNFGATTVYAGKTSGDANTSTTTVSAASGSRLAVKYNMGAVDLIAQMTKQRVGTAAESNVAGLRVDYTLSKTAAVYLGYEKYDTCIDATATSTANGDRKIMSAGLRKSF